MQKSYTKTSYKNYTKITERPHKIIQGLQIIRLLDYFTKHLLLRWLQKQYQNLCDFWGLPIQTHHDPHPV